MKEFVVMVALVLIMGSCYIPRKSYAEEGTSDEAAITETVLNYAEGWYTGDIARLKKALHPDLAKRGLQFSGTDPSLRKVTVEGLVASASNRKGQTIPEGPEIAVIILDIYEDIATVRLNTPWFVDYIHLTKWNEEWLILNVLWQSWK